MRLTTFYVLILLFHAFQQKTEMYIILEKADTPPNGVYLLNLRQFLSRLVHATRIERCLAIITDDFYLNLYERELFGNAQQFLSYYFIKVGHLEDLLSPHYQTTQVLKQIRTHKCDLHLITLLNGLQTRRFLQFVDKYRVLNAHDKFVLLHDERLFKPDMLHIWTTMLQTIFIKHTNNESFSISSIAYPGSLNGILIMQHLRPWTAGKRLRVEPLFADKTRNLKGMTLPVAVFEHVPMVQWSMATNAYEGVEIEIVNVLAKALNFRPDYYKSDDDDGGDRWGRQLPNDTYTGLIGQVTSHRARIGIGNLHPFLDYNAHFDLSSPYNFACLTFLTPESTTDNSWKTLILPFSGGMWLGVLLSLFLVGTVFYVFSFVYAILMRTKATKSQHFFRLLRFCRPNGNANTVDPALYRNVHFRRKLHSYRRQRLTTGDLFDSYANCILFTYSMLMYVSLPRVPRNWPLRVLTGWYWIYCILLTVTYRASFTAILANPAARISIDTLTDLVASQIKPVAWGVDHQQFFYKSWDEIAQTIGANMELIPNAEQVILRIAKGEVAYYDNALFLRYLREQDKTQRLSSDVLHIMRQCVINMPVALGLEKNSPLKPYIDKHLQHLSESGLIAKWLKDATAHLPAEEQAPQEALINLSKFWSAFVALTAGYLFAFCALIAEKYHFKYVVCKHPLYDVYNPSLYYNFKTRYSHL